MNITPIKQRSVKSFANDQKLEDAVDRIVSLAQEARYNSSGSAEATHVIPNFTKIQVESGRWLFIADTYALLSAFVIRALLTMLIDVILLQGGFQDLFSYDTAQHTIIFAAIGAIALLWFDTKGHYRQRLPHWEMVGHILAVASICFVSSGFIEFATKSLSSRLWMGLSWVLFGVFIFIGRYAVRTILERQGRWHIHAVVIGRGTTAQGALHALSRENQMGFTIVGQLPSNALHDLSEPHAWKRMLMAFKASHVFLALEGSEIERHPNVLKAMVRSRVPCSIVPPWLGLPSSTLSPHHFMMHDVMIMHDNNRLELPLPKFLKRSFDVCVAGTALILLLPVFCAIALSVRSDGAAAMFTQSRVGKNGKLFKCYKFRSMRVDADAALETYLKQNSEAAEEWKRFQKLQNDVRITKVGHFIRRTSLDELPQLINVVKGEMSLVGPRPCMPGQEALYAEDFSFYTSVRPGITGPWQVSGRNKLTFKERVALEAWYARNWSLWMDIVILLKTIPTLLKRGQAF